MPEFPVERLRPKAGWLVSRYGFASVEIELETFAIEGVDEPIETTLSLDRVRLPEVPFSELAEKTFEYPRNPEDGYIDGSIYIEHAHHPVDVTRIEFGAFDGEKIDVELDMNLIFEFEGLEDFSNTAWLCRTQFKCEEPDPSSTD